MERKPRSRSNSSDIGSNITSGVGRRSFIVTGLTAGSAALAGCLGDSDDGDDASDDSADDAADDQMDGRLQVGLDNSPIEFDPIVLNDIPSSQVCAQIYSTLYRYDEGLGYVPDLAAGDFEVIDDTTYIVELRDDAEFHNGEPVTVDDVIYSMTAPVEEETPNAPYFNGIEEFDVDGNTIEITLEAPDPVFPINALMSFIVPEDVRENDPDFISNPVGSGPFQFDDWSEGDFVRLERWDDYWGDENANLAEVEFEPIEESTTRVTSLETGSADVIQGIPPDLFPQVENMDNAYVDSAEAFGYFYIGFNCNEGPTADPLVREAVDYCFSMDQAVSNFVEPAGQRAYAPLNRPIIEEWGFPEDEWADIQHNEPDLDMAEQLLDEAGVSPDNWEPTMIVPPDDMRENIGISVTNGLEELGYNTQVQRLEWGTYLDTYTTGDPDDYHMYALGTGGGPDPENILPWEFSHDTQGTNSGLFYFNDEMNDRLTTAGQITDQDERREHYEFVIETILEDRVHLPAYTLDNSWGVNDVVQDFNIHASSHYNPRLHSPVSNTWVDR